MPQSNDKESSSNEDEEASSLPISNEVKITAHTKGVQALAIDKEGTRMATGGLDY